MCGTSDQRASGLCGYIDDLQCVAASACFPKHDKLTIRRPAWKPNIGSAIRQYFQLTSLGVDGRDISTRWTCLVLKELTEAKRDSCPVA